LTRPARATSAIADGLREKAETRQGTQSTMITHRTFSSKNVKFDFPLDEFLIGETFGDQAEEMRQKKVPRPVVYFVSTFTVAVSISLNVFRHKLHLLSQQSLMACKLSKYT
jgi:hypothetical protein